MNKCEFNFMINLRQSVIQKDEEVMDQFCEQLDETYNRLHKYEMKIVLGDCNGKIGKQKK